MSKERCCSSLILQHGWKGYLAVLLAAMLQEERDEAFGNGAPAAGIWVVTAVISLNQQCDILCEAPPAGQPSGASILQPRKVLIMSRAVGALRDGTHVAVLGDWKSCSPTRGS